MSSANVLNIVIPVHNRKALTRTCLDSLKHQTERGFRVIVVDDGSCDGTSEMLAADFPEVTCLRGHGDLWWSGAVNFALGRVLEQGEDTDFALLMNNDTVVSLTYLSSLVNTAKTHPHALIGSIAVSGKDSRTILDGGVRMNWLSAKMTRLGKAKDYQVLSAEGVRFENVDVLSGRGMLVPLRAFRDLGLFNVARLPHYGADYEFAVRAKRFGYDLIVDYQSVVVSNEATSDRQNEASRFNWKDFVKSYFSIRSPYCLKYRLIFAWLVCPRLLLIPYVFCDLLRIVIGRVWRQITRSQQTVDP